MKLTALLFLTLVSCGHAPVVRWEAARIMSVSQDLNGETEGKVCSTEKDESGFVRCANVSAHDLYDGPMHPDLVENQRVWIGLDAKGNMVELRTHKPEKP